MYSRSVRNGKREENAGEKPSVYQLPPNYRGMLSESFVPSEKNAEGIVRLVDEDENYKQKEMQKRKKEVSSSVQRPKITPAESESDGIYRLIEGLTERKFTPDDVLICSMIIMMLNGKSDDDILMVLVLMMLL
ncbi:MAG: hypothetical protein IKU45_00350 [Clostridia bacterium]|nr:hypothetical protein [Clostridia bacterium]